MSNEEKIEKVYTILDEIADGYYYEGGGKEQDKDWLKEKAVEIINAIS